MRVRPASTCTPDEPRPSDVVYETNPKGVRMICASKAGDTSLAWSYMIVQACG